jgi:hypothetical protein
MKGYLEAHDAFVEWLEGAAGCAPTAVEVEHALFDLAQCAAERGMSEVHWAFVIDGLVAHARRRCPDNPELAAYIARGFDFAAKWRDIEAEVAKHHVR